MDQTSERATIVARERVYQGQIVRQKCGLIVNSDSEMVSNLNGMDKQVSE